MVVGVGIKTRYLLKAVEVGYRRGSVEGTKFFRDSSARSERRYIQGMPRGKHVCKFHKTVPNKYSSLLWRIEFRRSNTHKGLNGIRLRRAERGGT